MTDCNYACARRCSKSSRKNVCHRACKSCCTTCHCVPPGTYGNKGLCPCYAKLKTHGNKPKCPWMCVVCERDFFLHIVLVWDLICLRLSESDHCFDNKWVFNILDFTFQVQDHKMNSMLQKYAMIKDNLDVLILVEWNIYVYHKIKNAYTKWTQWQLKPSPATRALCHTISLAINIIT